MNKKAYIIEDDANFLYSLQAKLSLAGCQVKIDLGNAEVSEILKDIKKYQPDFIILDLILPKLDGLDILKKLKSDDETSSFPIFIFTNMTDKDTRDKCFELGAKQVYYKTDLNTEELILKITKIFENLEKI
jgi:DNA-binding response OmpR family regulator